jgi:hypothetical protein
MCTTFDIWTTIASFLFHGKSCKTPWHGVAEPKSESPRSRGSKCFYIQIQSPRSVASFEQDLHVLRRLSALEELSGMEVLASDKTGTLTLNQLTLDKEDILAWGDSTKDDVLLMASLSAKWDHNDAIDKAVTAAMGGNVKVRIELVYGKNREGEDCVGRIVH